MLEKNLLPPTNGESTWILFTMTDEVNNIPGLINNFPKIGEEKGISASLVWSGIDARYNVRTTVFQGKQFGLVLNADHLLLSQGDVFAHSSGAKYTEEYKKGNVNKISAYGQEIEMPAQKTAYVDKEGNPQKPIYYRAAMGDIKPVTNLAKHKITGEKDETGRKQSICLEEGSPDVFAQNIMRQYLKSHKQAWKDRIKFYHEGAKIVNYNEAVVYQKEDTNPVQGIFLTNITAPIGKENAEKLLDIFDQNPQFKLYLYDNKAKNNIARYLEKDDIKNYLLDQSKDAFKNAFEKATPVSDVSEKTKDFDESKNFSWG